MRVFNLILQHKTSSVFLFLILLFSLSCSGPSVKQETVSAPLSYFKNDEPGVKTGNIKIIPVKTAQCKFNIWTKQFGNNPAIKVLLLNGGPGLTHEYFECFENFFPQENIEFIYYDQLGCGYSDNPKDTNLWELSRFVEEVEQVRTALNLNKDNFYLLGHSWGGILAMQYALKYQHNLKGLIISNMMCSCPEYGKYAQEVLARQMNPKVLDTIRNIEAKGDFNNPKYMDLLMKYFYAEHICRIPLEQWPEPVKRSMSKLNSSLYITMQGPSEFGIAGNLAKWDVKAELKKLSVPTLCIGGKYDTMDPDHMKQMSKLVQNGSYLYCANGSHMSLYDDQQNYMNGLIRFIKAIDAGKKKAG